MMLVFLALSVVLVGGFTARNDHHTLSPRFDQSLRRAAKETFLGDTSSRDPLLCAVGAGTGKMGRADKRTKKNKYASKAPLIDPFEQTVASSRE